MKSIFLLLSAIILHLDAQARQTKIEVYSAERLAQRVKNTDTVYVINFWATWCAPCVQELPEFDTLQQAYEGKPVKVLLVSFDFKDEYQQKIPLFVAKKNPLPEIVWFRETNANVFIPKIDNSWTGSIPATWIVSAAGNYRKFLEKTITARELQALIDPQLALLSASKSRQ